MAGVAIILGACGGDSAESVEAAVAEAAPALSYVEEADGPCVARVVMDVVGFEELLLVGSTTDSIRESPEESIATIFEDHDSEDLRTGVFECIDVDAMVREQLLSFNDGASLDCSTEFSRSTDFVSGHLNDRFDGGDSELQIADVPENRDALRPCLGETEFGDVFGLDRRQDLERAIEDGLEGEVRSDDVLCAAPALIDQLGSVESVNEAGITVDTPKITIDDLDLDRDGLISLFDAVADCGSFAEGVAEHERTAEPTFEGCLVESFESDEQWRRALVEAALGGTERSADLYRSRALNSCVGERVAEVFDDLEPGDRQLAAQVGIGAFEEP